MKDIQKTLLELTQNRLFQYYKESNCYCWSFNIGNNSILKLENITDNLIKITIRTEKKSQKLGKVTIEKHTVVDVNQIKEFILTKINDINESKYKDDLMKKERHYKNVIDIMLQNKSIKNFKYEINLHEKRIYINEDNNINHVLIIHPPHNTNSILSCISVQASLLLEKDDVFKVHTMNIYYSPLELDKYCLIKKVLNLNSNDFIREYSFDMMIDNIRNESVDESLVTTLSYLNLHDNLPVAERKEKSKNKI